nr:ATP synthase F0 subunit 8 [Venerupis aspera]YP_010455418.1 ATP synthase F0 subunit 8 [Ruditapes variegatus]QUA05873.1 ATP synthase F0 subunit 8 [Venerupis aspera]UUA63023.1 ATP synthase subunit 8 [Ruditapes variegatus]
MVMAQFAPMMCLFVFLYVWCVFVMMSCFLWWCSKRCYSF